MDTVNLDRDVAVRRNAAAHHAQQWFPCPSSNSISGPSNWVVALSNTYCFGDLLVVEDVNFHYLASQFTKAGDSGAWVVSTRAGHASWDAMLIAGDGANAYCCYSENIMAMIDPGLSIPP